VSSPAAALDHPIPWTNGMTVDSIFYQPGDIAPIPEISQLDRIGRLADLGPEDTIAGLLWLAMNFPAVCDAMLDKTESDAVDDDDPCQEPEPFCAECGASIGIFLRDGTDWRHYLGDVTTTGQLEVFDPGHDPVVAWRLPGMPA